MEWPAPSSPLFVRHSPWNLQEYLGGSNTHTLVYGAFHHKGDRLQLWDRCQKNSFTGYLQVRNGAEMKTYYVARKGMPHRCGERWINRNFREGRDIGIRACLAIPSDWDTCSPWRWGIA
jgi:hypothetical protein